MSTNAPASQTGWLLFAGQNYYPLGGADDFVSVFYGDLDAAVAWVETLAEGSERWYELANWKHLARLQGGSLDVVKRWTRDYVVVDGKDKMGSWEVDESD